MSEDEIELKGIFSEGYGIIPKKIMRNKQLNVYDKAILSYMLSFSGGGNSCFPSYKTMADDLSISETTLSKSIKKLSETGYIKKEKLYPNDNLRHNSKYILCFINSDTTSEEVPTLHEMEYRHSTRWSSNNNSINNNKKNNIIPTLQEVEDYITAKKYNVVAHTFFNYYEALGWKDKNGKEVKNWKLKLLTWHNHSPVTNESLNNNKKKFKDYE